MSLKTVLISGANSGIGFATALHFAREKYEVLALDISDEINKELSAKLSTLGCKYTYFQCDVSSLKEVETLFQDFNEKGIVFSVLVNNAGILGPRSKTKDYPYEDFDRVIDVNIKGVFYLMKCSLVIFEKQKSGTIVNTASVAGHVGMHSHIAYSASKHAVVGMTKTAAVEYAKLNIRVNAVCPGFTKTAMLNSAESEYAYTEGLKFVTPMRRFGEASEIASAIYFLGTDASSFMTGQSIILDGGLTAQ